MDFQREFVQVTLEGIRYYGIVVALIIMVVAAFNARQEIGGGKEPRQAYTSLGIFAVIAVVIAVGALLRAPSEAQDVQIRYYGVIIVVGMLLATMIAARIAQRTGRDPEHVYGALTWAIIPGIIGARLWFVFFPPATLVEAGKDTSYYLNNFLDTTDGAIAIWSGGLSIFGAVLGGLLGAYIYLRKNRLPVGEWLDVAAIVLPLGQAIGRWANYVNQELFGKPITQDWLEWIGLTIPREIRESVGYSGIIYEDAKFHPLFLYESLWSLAAFFVLLWLFNNHRDRFRVGDFFLLYVAQYSFIRFLLEFLRVETTLVPGSDLNLSQVVTGVLFLLSLAMFLIRRQGASEEGYQITPMEMREEEEGNNHEAETAQATT